jgi:hypothetical protein
MYYDLTFLFKRALKLLWAHNVAKAKTPSQPRCEDTITNHDAM